jgi:hypothetical protein
MGFVHSPVLIWFRRARADGSNRTVAYGNKTMVFDWGIKSQST